MQALEEFTVGCPYCGEHIAVLIDPEEVGNEYLEDCQVCCRPIIFLVGAGSMGELLVSVRDENEVC